MNRRRDLASRRRLQAPAKGSNAAAAHQIEPAQLLPIASIVNLLSGQQHRQIPGRTRLTSKKAAAKAQLGSSFAIVNVLILQRCDCRCTPHCRLG